MTHPNRKSDGTPRLGRPPGPSHGRGKRPWDAVDWRALLTVAANPDMERYRIAEYLGMSSPKLSNITCSPEGCAALEWLQKRPQEELAQYKIVDENNDQG